MLARAYKNRNMKTWLAMYNREGNFIFFFHTLLKLLYHALHIAIPTLQAPKTSFNHQETNLKKNQQQ